MKFPVVHLGGEHCVTDSCKLLQAQGMNMLIDCGQPQGVDSGISQDDGISRHFGNRGTLRFFLCCRTVFFQD